MTNDSHPGPTRPISTLIDFAIDYADADMDQARRLLTGILDRRTPDHAIAAMREKWLHEINGRLRDWSLRKWGKDLHDYQQLEIELELMRTRHRLECGEDIVLTKQREIEYEIETIRAFLEGPDDDLHEINHDVRKMLEGHLGIG